MYIHLQAIVTSRRTKRRLRTRWCNVTNREPHHQTNQSEILELLRETPMTNRHNPTLFICTISYSNSKKKPYLLNAGLVDCLLGGGTGTEDCLPALAAGALVVRGEEVGDNTVFLDNDFSSLGLLLLGVLVLGGGGGVVSGGRRRAALL